MLEINNKLVLIWLSLLSLILLSSCSYENTTIDLGSGFDSTWTFSNSNEYEFDENLVEVVNGKAQLKVLDLEHSGDDFISGSHVGSFYGSSVSISQPLNIPGITNLFPEKNSNLIGYWSFENNLLDSSSNMNHLTLGAGGVFNQFGKLGESSLSFDGSTDYAFSTNPNNMDLTQFTLSAWIKPINVGLDYQVIMEKSFSTSERNFWLAIWSDGSLGLRFSSGGVAAICNIYGGKKLYDGNWHHVVATMDGQACTLYLDGEQDGVDTTVSAPDFTTSPFEIGRQGGGNYRYFSGDMDEVYILDTPLTANEVKTMFQAQIGSYTGHHSSWTPKWESIVGYWSMDGNWQDFSGNRNHGTQNGDAHFSNKAKVGSSSGDFDGAGDYINLGFSDLPSNEELSVAAWIHPDNIAGWVGRKSVSYGGKNDRYNLWVEDNNKLYIIVRSNTGSTFYRAGYIESDIWTHILFSYKNGEGGAVYVNGQKLGTLNDVGPIKDCCSAFTIKIGANWDGNGEFWPGKIDEFTIWNSKLSAGEVSQVYNRQKQKYAGHYDSRIIDLGSTTSIWPDISWSTSLPFGKEIVGDFDNDGNLDAETVTDYTSLNSSLGLVGGWHLNEISSTSGAGNDFKDYSLNGFDGEEVGSVSFAEDGILANGIGLDGDTNHISLPAGTLPTGNKSIFAWIKMPEVGTSVGQNHDYVIYAGSNGVDLVFLYFDDGIRLRFLNTSNGSSLIHPVALDDELWHFVGYTYDGTTQKLYLDGKEVKAGSGLDTFVTTDEGIGGVGANTAKWLGVIDEVSLWSRALSGDEVTQLYRRGANRIKLQIKSCVDSSCNCKSFGVGGSKVDCDGDGILNTSDTDDIHKSEFIGPGGDGTTYYSELFNRTSSEVTFNCALNITDGDAGVCAPDEITLTGGPKPTGPEFLNIDYTQFVTPSANRYAQYRVYMEADDNTACDGEPCLPELTSVSLNPTGAVRYSSDYVKVKPKSPITFTKLFSAQIDAEPCASFRLSRSNTEYYFDGTSWVLATLEAHRNTAREVEKNITKFASDHGAGELEANAYLSSDATQSSQCSVDAIDIKFE